MENSQEQNTLLQNSKMKEFVILCFGGKFKINIKAGLRLHLARVAQHEKIALKGRGGVQHNIAFLILESL